MSANRLPELLRGLGVEPFLDDAATLQRLADVAWISPAGWPRQAMRTSTGVSSKCSSGCTQRLSLLKSDVFEIAAAGSRRLH